MKLWHKVVLVALAAGIAWYVYTKLRGSSDVAPVAPVAPVAGGVTRSTGGARRSTAKPTQGTAASGTIINLKVTK